MRKVTRTFANAMDSKLRLNEHKNAGSKEEIGQDCSVGYLIEGLMSEVAELIDAVYEDHFDAADVLYEAADVANYAMMLANKCAKTKGDKK